MDKSTNSADTDAARKRIGRPPKYDWTDKKDICHQLYVQEQKSAAEIQKYFSEHFHLELADLPWYVIFPHMARTSLPNAFCQS